VPPACFSPPSFPHPAPRGSAKASSTISPLLPPRSLNPPSGAAAITSEPTSAHSKEAASGRAIPSFFPGENQLARFCLHLLSFGFSPGSTKEPHGRSPAAPALGWVGQWEGRGETRGWGWRQLYRTAKGGSGNNSNTDKRNTQSQEHTMLFSPRPMPSSLRSSLSSTPPAPPAQSWARRHMVPNTKFVWVLWVSPPGCVPSHAQIYRD